MVRIQKPKGQLWLPKFPTLLYGTKWYPCCGPPNNCERCVFDPPPRPEQWICDLGAGGWADDLCSHCDQVAGQYTLDHVAAAGQITARYWIGMQHWLYGHVCLWVYQALDVCTFEDLVGAEQIDFDILLYHHSVGLGATWKWFAEVKLYVTPFYFPPPYASWALYASEETDEANCLHFGGEDSTDKLTLTRYANQHVGVWVPDMCSGTLPATIDLWIP